MKNILITGAGGTLGQACITELSDKGYHILAVLSPGKQLAFKSNDYVSVYNCNLLDEDESTGLVKRVIGEHQTIDSALMLAGGFAMGTVKETDGASLKKMLGLNFETAYHISRAIFDQMTKQAHGGRLVFVGAKPALNPTAGKDKIAYALSKSLIFKWAELLNTEGNKNNVVSTVVVPSIIDSTANRKSMPKANPDDWVTAEEIASIISFAISDEAGKIREPVLKIYGAS